MACVALSHFWPDSSRPARLLCPRDSLGKNTGVGCHALIQRLFPTQGPSMRLLQLLLASRFFTTEPVGKLLYTWKAHYSEKHLQCVPIAYLPLNPNSTTCPLKPFIIQLFQPYPPICILSCICGLKSSTLFSTPKIQLCLACIFSSPSIWNSSSPFSHTLVAVRFAWDFV